MTTANPLNRIQTIIQSDPVRMHALAVVEELNLSDWLIAAGFVRNAIWDHMFGQNTPMNDLDVIHFCLKDPSEQRDRALEDKLKTIAPELPWSVKNQARMHLRNGDPAYQNTRDAMAHWPEKQTAIGVRLVDGDLVVVQCFDLNLQFNGCIDHNPARDVSVFRSRLLAKNWLQNWPKLKTDPSVQ